MSGKRTGIIEYSQSTAENMAKANASTPMASAGASEDVDGRLDDEPMCKQMTVSVSSHACMNGSQ